MWNHFLTCTDDKRWKVGKRKAEKDAIGKITNSREKMRVVAKILSGIFYFTIKIVFWIVPVHKSVS